MDNPQHDSGLGQSTPNVNEPVVPAPPFGGASPSTPSHPEELGVLSAPTPLTPPFLGDRSSAPPPFVIGKPPESPEPPIPPEPIPEEKLVPNRIILIVVAILVVVLLAALWWFFRPKASPQAPSEVPEPPLIEGPSPTSVIPAEAELPAVNPSPTIALAASPTRTPERVTPTPSQTLRASPTPIPTVPEKSLPEVGSVSQTFFMVISGLGAIITGMLLLL